MKEKEFYISPDVLIFNVKVGGVICTSGEFGINGFGDDEGDPLSGFTGI